MIESNENVLTVADYQSLGQQSIRQMQGRFTWIAPFDEFRWALHVQQNSTTVRTVGVHKLVTTAVSCQTDLMRHAVSRATVVEQLAGRIYARV